MNENEKNETSINETYINEPAISKTEETNESDKAAMENQKEIDEQEKESKAMNEYESNNQNNRYEGNGGEYAESAGRGPINLSKPEENKIYAYNGSEQTGENTQWNDQYNYHQGGMAYNNMKDMPYGHNMGDMAYNNNAGQMAYSQGQNADGRDQNMGDGSEFGNQSSIHFVTMERKRKNHKFLRRTAAVCATVAVFGAATGFGAVIGVKTSENMPIENSVSSEFKFSDMPEAEQMSISDNNEIINIVKNTSSSVVNISIKAQQTDFFNRVYENTGSGSGIVYKEDNEKYYIVTNNHVVDGATSVSISVTGQEQIAAKLVGKDAQSDVAVISVLKSDVQNANVTDIKTAEFADSDSVEVGEYVLAIGNALGQGKTVTQGIISAQNKQVDIDGKKLNVLQTDAAINPGNSGGALVNSSGKIIGMNTAKISGTTVEGTGYALPSTSVKNIAEELIANGTVSKPYLGITGFTISDDFMMMYDINTRGVFIKGVEDSSAASAAGLRYSDIITSINGTAVTSIEDLSSMISKCKVGDTIQIGIIRNGRETMTVSATLQDMNSNF